MHWMLVKKRLIDNWAVFVIIILLAFIAYKMAVGDMQLLEKPELEITSIYDENYGSEECYILMTGHVVNYGGTYALNAKAICRIDNSVETIKWWEFNLGDMTQRSKEVFREKVDIPCSKVTRVECDVDCLNC